MNNAQIRTRPATNIGDFAVGAQRPKDLSVEVKVNDDQIRHDNPGFDGLESVFALVPRRADGDVRWERHNLAYAGSSRRIVGGELFSGRPQKRDDLHRLHLKGVDAQTVQELGIAFGAQTNVGTVWAQSLGANFFVGR